MKTKILLNRLGSNPDLTSRQPRVDSLSLVSRQSDLLTYLGRIAAILVLVLTLGVGNAWGYTITFKTTTGNSDGTQAKTTKTDVIDSGGDYVTSSFKATYLYYGANSSGIRFGSGNYAGTMTLPLTSTGTSIGQIKASKITFKNAKYYSSDASTLGYSISYTSGSATTGSITLTTTAKDYDVELDEARTISQIYINASAKKKRFYITAVEITAASAAPSYTVAATSNNNSYGTVSVSGTTITASPEDCYQVKSGDGGYSLISGTATISHSGTSNTISVTPTSNCSIQVIFEKQTVNTYVDEIQGYEDMEECGTHDAPSLDDKTVASSGTCAQQHWHFMGWVTAANKANPTDANIITPGTEMTANGTTYFAVWAKGTGGGGFDGEHGGTFKIYAIDDEGTKNYMTNTVSSNKISSTTTEASAQEYTLTAVTGGFTISYKESSTTYYVYHGGTNTSNISIGTTAATWNIVEGINGSWRVKSPYSTRSLIYRNTNVFAAYANSNATSTSTEYYDLEIGGGYEYSDYITTCGSTYTITLAGSPAGTVTGGTFSANAASASQGTVITLTATPKRGYGLGSWNVTDASSNPVTVTSNQFTMPSSNVTVSATFNALTPLTITLSTKSKGTFTNPDPWPIYSGETFTFPDVTPNDPTCATFVGWIQGTTFPGDGSTHDEPTGLITAGTESTAQTTDATYTAVFYETETTESDAYVKVTSAPANWANDHYLIVYEGDATHAAVAFDGKRDNGDNGNIDAASNGVEVTITNDAIAKTARLAAAEWRIAAVTGGHSIQSASGFYIGQATDANGLQNNSSTAYVNTLAYSSGFSVTGSGNAVLRYNYASDQLRFRYYKSSSYSSQQVIQLYKLGTAEVQTRTYTTNPSCTPKYRVTVASVTGGSPNADPRYNPETTEVSLTANPSAGYAFTGWTITKTTGGQNVTSTLLPGTKATTANTTFSMPAYDVTVTAAYSKKAVTELKVMDGSTVVANTTGSVSGTLNVSTDANKTLDVVITPSDAFDHSWTASVTAGGTYASISNVTDGGFRVNGLTQGDATVTVTAPNEGSAKVVTFTVHVTDILPEEIILKRDGSETPINALTIYLDQYAKINVSYSPTPTDKAFTFSSADATSVSSRAHAPTSGYETLHGLKVTSSPVNCTFTSAATSSVTKVLAVTVLALPADQFVDYIHGNATVTRAAQVSADHWSINTSITTPTLSDAAESASADCEAGHYHLIGWLPQSIAEALFAAGTPITSATEGLVAAGAEIEASGITWYAIWAKKE